MAIDGLTLLQDATSVTASGGTTITLEADGVSVANGIHVADMGEDNFLIRTNVTARTRQPQKQPDGSYSKAKRFFTVVVPMELASGDHSYNLVRIEIEQHPEMTVAQRKNLYYLAAQLLCDPDTDGFRLNGSVK